MKIVENTTSSSRFTGDIRYNLLATLWIILRRAVLCSILCIRMVIGWGLWTMGPTGIRKWRPTSSFVLVRWMRRFLFRMWQVVILLRRLRFFPIPLPHRVRPSTRTPHKDAYQCISGIVCRDIQSTLQSALRTGKVELFCIFVLLFLTLRSIFVFHFIYLFDVLFVILLCFKVYFIYFIININV